jgi:hypothetical protein
MIPSHSLIYLFNLSAHRRFSFFFSFLSFFETFCEIWASRFAKSANKSQKNVSAQIQYRYHKEVKNLPFHNELKRKKNHLLTDILIFQHICILLVVNLLKTSCFPRFFLSFPLKTEYQDVVHIIKPGKV